MITSRELSWITRGTPLAVTIHGHTYRGHALEQVSDGTWKVDVEGGLDDNGRHHLTGGGVYTCTRTGDCTIEHLLGPPYATSNPAGSL